MCSYSGNLKYASSAKFKRIEELRDGGWLVYDVLAIIELRHQNRTHNTASIACEVI